MFSPELNHFLVKGQDALRVVLLRRYVNLLVVRVDFLPSFGGGGETSLLRAVPLHWHSALVPGVELSATSPEFQDLWVVVAGFAEVRPEADGVAIAVVFDGVGDGGIDGADFLALVLCGMWGVGGGGGGEG